LSLVQTVRFLKDPFSLLSECFDRFGPVFRLELLGLGTWVFVCEPGLVKQLFKANPGIVRSGEINSRQLGFLLGTDATFSKDGEDHLERRRIMLPHFNGKAAKQQIPLIRQTALRSMERWPSSEFSIQPWAHHLSLEILGHIFFGASEGPEIKILVEKFERFANQGLRSLLIMIPWLQIDLGRRSPWGKILKMRQEVFATIQNLVHQRLEDRQGFADRDVASKMVNSMGPDGPHLSFDSVVEEIVNDIFAGHETTGNILAWCTECIVSRPPILERLREELDSTLGDRPIEATDLRHLPYLDAVIQESIRYRPLAPMAGMRLTKEDFQLGGYTLPAETIIVQCFPVMARRQDLYRAPDEFDPDHFLENRPPAYHWNPFGGGRRMCLGKGLAEVELAVIVAEMLRRYDIGLQQDSVEPVRDGVFFSPSLGLRVRVRPRHIP
jgi:cytochrome P450